MIEKEALPCLTDADWLNRAETQAIFAALTQEGHELRAVGGAVRNTLLGLDVTDVDLATTAPPEAVIALAKRAGLKAVPTGIEHGTVTVISNHHPYEVTTLRQDVETDGRRATVAFTSDWAEDARRRDFTMNALYVSSDGVVHDPLGGYADLAAGRVRFIGDPRQRIREDFLRILRFFRFNADYGEGPIDSDGISACIRERAGLAKLSAERVRAELFRLLQARSVTRTFETLYDTGLLVDILGSVPNINHVTRLIDIETSLGREADAVLRLSALAVLVCEDTDRLAVRLRLSKAERQRLQKIAATAPIFHSRMDELDAKIALYRLGPDRYRDRVLISWARSGEPLDNKPWRKLLTLPESWVVPEFPLTGTDISALGTMKGPAIGQILRDLEAQWINDGFSVDRDALLLKAQEMVRSAK